LNSIFKNQITFEFLSSHFSERSVCTSKTKPTSEQTADPTIDSTVNPSAELWPTPIPTGILSLEVNIKKQKRLFNIYVRI
jgi:hypothetical protein